MSLIMILLFRMFSNVPRKFKLRFDFCILVRKTVGIWNPDYSEFRMFKKRLINGLDFEWDLKSRCPTFWNPGKWQPVSKIPFEIWTKMSWFWIIQLSNGWDYSHRYGHCCSPTLCTLDNLKSDLQEVQIWSFVGFGILAFKIPTVSNPN